jgi:SAM-dependent methyltransferase
VNPSKRIFPELAVGGYTRIDHAVDFYVRVGALLTPDSVVVDFGAGRGRVMDEPDTFRRRMRIFTGRVRKVIGVDPDPVVLENRSVDEALVWTPGTPIDLPDASVDLVVSDFTFEHIDDPVAVEHELGRILKPGGWVCARTPNRWGYIAIGSRLIPTRWHRTVLTRLLPWREERDIFPAHYLLNTFRAVRHTFPESRWEVHGYTTNGEPTYTGRWTWSYLLSYYAMRLLPERFREMHLFFIRKVDTLRGGA